MSGAPGQTAPTRAAIIGSGAWGTTFAALIAEAGGSATIWARRAEIAEDVFGPDRVDVRESLADAVDRAAEIAEAGAEPADRSGVLVCGSVMLAGEMLALAGHSPR